MIFNAGRDLTRGAQTHLRGLLPGKDYIFQYKAPAFAFALLSATQMQALVQGWTKLDPSKHTEEIMTINGVSVNTGNGDIVLRGSVSRDAGKSGNGVNPYAIAAINAAIFSNIGVGISLLYVYDVAGGRPDGPAK